MLSLRCRINANVAELLVIIGYSDLRSELVRSLSTARPPAYTLASLSLARLSGLSPGCLVAAARTGALPGGPPRLLTRFDRNPSATETEQLRSTARSPVLDARVNGAQRGSYATDDALYLTVSDEMLLSSEERGARRRRESAPWACEEREKRPTL